MNSLRAHDKAGGGAIQRCLRSVIIVLVMAMSLVTASPAASASQCYYAGGYTDHTSFTNTWNGTCRKIGTRAKYMSDWEAPWTAWKDLVLPEGEAGVVTLTVSHSLVIASGSRGWA